ncbi:MAG: hypothetical protein NTY53_16155 [Kiritimatiellaeota bacterium]|nr:hypothetical protein [Kiritimatiellota bacterium]
MKTPPISTSGIFFSDEFLAMDALSLEAKLFYLLIQRKPEPPDKHPATPLSHSRLAKLAGVSPSTSQRTLRKLKKLGPVTAATTGSGIFLSDEFLAADDLSLAAKVIYLLIKRDLESTGKYFTASLTDPRLAKMTDLSVATIQRKLKELDKAGYIALVSNSRAVERDARGLPSKIRGIRYIYLDRRKAGYRRRVIKKVKGRWEVEFLYSMMVLEKNMPPAQYVAWRKEEAAKWAEQQEKEEEFLAKVREEVEFTQLLAQTSDEAIANLEQAHEVPPGTYVKQKHDYLERNKAGDDGFFTDFGEGKSIP